MNEESKEIQEQVNTKKSKKPIILCLLLILIAAVATLVVLILFNDKGKDSKDKTPTNDTQIKEKTKEEENENSSEVEEDITTDKKLSEYCQFLEEGSYPSKDHTFTVSYKSTDYEGEIGNVYILIANEESKEIVNDTCFSLGNESIADLAINTDDTITILHSDSDDDHKWPIEKIDYQGNIIETKSVECQEKPQVDTDSVTHCEL